MTRDELTRRIDQSEIARDLSEFVTTGVKVITPAPSPSAPYILDMAIRPSLPQRRIYCGAIGNLSLLSGRVELRRHKQAVFTVGLQNSTSSGVVSSGFTGFALPNAFLVEKTAVASSPFNYAVSFHNYPAPNSLLLNIFSALFALAPFELLCVADELRACVTEAGNNSQICLAAYSEIP